MYSEPEWLRALKWFGMALALGAGIGYYYFAYRPASSEPPQTAAAAPRPGGEAAVIITRRPASDFPFPIPRSQLSEGRPAPDFILPTLDKSASLSLSQFSGQPVLVNFWASWCIPCRAEAGELERTYRAHKGDGFVILGVNSTAQDAVPEARAFVKKYGATYPILLDETDQASNGYSVIGLPTSVFIDRQGNVQRIFVGGMSGAQIDAYVSELLKAP